MRRALILAAAALAACVTQLPEFGEEEEPLKAVGYLDVDDHPFSSAAKRAIRAGELNGYRVGRTTYVEVRELRRWIEAHRVSPSKAVPEEEQDDVQKVIEMNQSRRKQKR